MFKSSNYAAPPALENCYSGPIRQGPAAHALHHAYGGFYGAAKAAPSKPAADAKLKAAVAAKPKKPGVSRKQVDDMLAKNKFLRDEDRKLAANLSSRDLLMATPLLKKLAKMRDEFRKQSIAAAEGKTAGQVAGRAYLGVVTLGASELGRLLVKKKISAARRKRAQAFLDKSVAADLLLRFYTDAFLAEAAKANKKPAAKLTAAEKSLLQTAKATGAKIETLKQDGAMAEDKTVSVAADPAVAAAAQEVEAEAPAAEVAKAASSEDTSAVQAPVATEEEATAITEATNAGAEPEKAADAAVEASGREEMKAKPGISNTTKVGIGVGAGVALLAAFKFLK